jgi:hypothetical protein
MVAGTRLHQGNHPAGPPTFDFAIERLPTVKADGRGHSNGAAKHRAEHSLVKKAEHPYAIVDVSYGFEELGEDKDGRREFLCTVTGVPVRSLEASGGGRG